MISEIIDVQRKSKTLKYDFKYNSFDAFNLIIQKNVILNIDLLYHEIPNSVYV